MGWGSCAVIAVRVGSQAATAHASASLCGCVTTQAVAPNQSSAVEVVIDFESTVSISFPSHVATGDVATALQSAGCPQGGCLARAAVAQGSRRRRLDANATSISFVIARRLENNESGALSAALVLPTLNATTLARRLGLEPSQLQVGAN